MIEGSWRAIRRAGSGGGTGGGGSGEGDGGGEVRAVRGVAWGKGDGFRHRAVLLLREEALVRARFGGEWEPERLASMREVPRCPYTRSRRSERGDSREVGDGELLSSGRSLQVGCVAE